MKISTEIYSSARHVGEEKAVELVAKAGFDAWDFSMFSLAAAEPGQYSLHDSGITAGEMLRFARDLKRIGLDNGIICNQSHAPFPSHLPRVRDCLKLAIECTAEAGGNICVIHPMNNATPEENAQMYWEYLPFAKAHGVKIATENMWSWDDGAGHSSFASCATADSFLSHLNAVGDDSFVACLDIGHAEMFGSGEGAGNMIRALGHHLQALHIHDNDRLHDSHQIPMSMAIDFGEVVRALGEIGYQGILTLEADTYLNDFTEETVLEGLKNMAQSAMKLRDMFSR